MRQKQDKTSVNAESWISRINRAPLPDYKLMIPVGCFSHVKQIEYLSNSVNNLIKPVFQDTRA
jgi:hypothetical protein